MQALREAKVEENTLVILTSDNGPWANTAIMQVRQADFERQSYHLQRRYALPCLFYWKGTIAPEASATT